LVPTVKVDCRVICKCVQPDIHEVNWHYSGK